MKKSVTGWVGQVDVGFVLQQSVGQVNLFRRQGKIER